MSTGKRKKIVLMTGGTETLEYFSLQLKIGFSELGYDIFLFDLKQAEESAEKLAHFAGMSDTILVAFNFDGQDYDTSLYNGNGELFWDTHDVACVNIVVDHPFYYPALYENLPRNYHEVSIDRTHKKYLERFYPEVRHRLFLPLAGTALYPDGNYPTDEERPIGVLFTGNFTPKEKFEQYIHRSGDEYAAFYLEIIEDLIAHPDLPDDAVMEQHLLREFPDATPKELRKLMSNMIFIDTYIRNYFREAVIRTLVEAKIPVHCIGHGWDLLESHYKDYLTYEKNQHSYACLERMTQAKLSINVMPWFKEGAHDRVFNAMANGSISVTDRSIYMDEILTDGKNAVFYDLSHIDELPDKVQFLLTHPEKRLEITQEAFAFTKKSHTWLVRARQLNDAILKKL